MTTPPLKVKCIDHVTLVVEDLERSKGFYCGVLGMDCVTRPGFDFPGLWFQAGNTQIHLIRQHPGSAPAGFPAPPEYSRPGRTFHFAFEVDDGQSAAAQLQAAGVQMKGEPRLRPDGCLQLFCLDPDGHVVEVFSRPSAGPN
jgi:catechol 2,3-dioxygenase-like lactoylglutathione lyase family enzyme